MKINKALARGLENTMYVKATKTGISRTISLDEQTLDLLKEWQIELKTTLGKAYKKKHQLVIPNEENNFLQPTKTRKWLNYVIQKYKLPPFSEILENNTIKSSAEAAKTLADLAKEVLKSGKISDDITNTDQLSSTEYLPALRKNLTSINLQINNCTNPDEKIFTF